MRPAPATLALSLAASSLFAAPLLVPAPALAASTTITDDAGDGSDGPDLDITRVKLRNGAKQVVVDVAYVRVTTGDQIVFLKARGVKGTLRAISIHRPGRDKEFLVDQRGEKQPCAGLDIDWDAASDTSVVRVPAACINDGDYAALKTFVLTEIGSDTDVAPQTSDGDFAWSGYVDRG